MFKKRVLKGKDANKGTKRRRADEDGDAEVPPITNLELAAENDENDKSVDEADPGSSSAIDKETVNNNSNSTSKNNTNNSANSTQFKGGFGAAGSAKKFRGRLNGDNKASEPLITRDDIKREVNAMGPTKAVAVNVRVTTLTDFQPDVCKDFQQTGYCGYGDTCKFLHIRDELKQKKPIEKEWENVTKTDQIKNRANDNKSNSSVNTDEIADTDSNLIPFKCVLCKKDYVSPVRTNCGHIFCQKCFFTRSKKKKECFICGKDTLGACQPVGKEEMAKLLA